MNTSNLHVVVWSVNVEIISQNNLIEFVKAIIMKLKIVCSNRKKDFAKN